VEGAISLMTWATEGGDDCGRALADTASGASNRCKAPLMRGTTSSDPNPLLQNQRTISDGSERFKGCNASDLLTSVIILRLAWGACGPESNLVNETKRVAERVSQGYG
jgi:hypothetical protein